MPVPGLEIAKRQLNFYYLLDTSGSMSMNGRIQSLNQSVRQSIPGMSEAASSQPNATLKVHAIEFNSSARWHTYPGVDVDAFIWQDLSANGSTSMGKAIDLLCDDLENNMPSRSLPPVIVMVSDGHPTDNFDSSLKRLMSSPWGCKSVRIAIGMGPDREIDWGVMERFMFNMEIKPLHAHNSTELANYISWASTVAVTVSSSGATAQQGNSTYMPIPEIPQTVLDPGAVF
jgi:uncharacterized protein YegL